MSRDAVADLTKERRAAEALRDTLAKMPGMDEETTRDTIEGETDLHGAIAGVVEMLTEAEAMSAGLGATIEKFQARKSRFDARIEFLRATIEQAMVIGELRKVDLPEVTLSLGARAANVVITDETMIPAKFWKPLDAVLDKTALKQALKDKQDVPGATLGNGTLSLTVRRN